MTDREKFNIEETKRIVADRACGVCEVCGGPLTPQSFQLGHRIIQSKKNIKRYGKHVVHHPLNQLGTCCETCNKRAIVHGLAEEQLGGRIRIEIERETT